MPLGPLDSLAGYHLRHAYALFGADFARVFADTDMRQVLFGVLSILFANPGINQGKVGKALGVQRTNMVALINQLVELGMVKRSLDREDRRAFSLDLTERGRETVNVTLARIMEHEERMLSALNAEERQTLLALLKKLNARAD